MNHKQRLFLVITCLILISALTSTQHRSVTAQTPTGQTVYLPAIYSPDPPVWMGPGGGSIVCIAPDPVNANIVYAGTISDGVYKSYDGGGSWSRASNGLGNLFIDSLAVDPAEPATVYAGTHGMGVYKSTNGGANWSPVNTGIADKSVVYTLAVNPGNHNLVYAGTRIQDTEYTGIVYKSNDGGAKWSNVMEFSDDWVYSIRVNPSSPYLVLAAIHTRGPVYSYNYGNKGTWNSGMPPAFGDDYLTQRWMKGRSVAFDPRGWMNRAYYSSWNDGFVSYSENNGENWQMSSGVGGARIYPNGIFVNPDNPNIVYLAAHSTGAQEAPGGVLKSTDSGSSFAMTNFQGKNVYSVVALDNGSTVLAGTYSQGLFRSIDDGAAWQSSVNGLLNSKVTGIVFYNGAMYASTDTGGGVWRSMDSGFHWSEFNAGLNDFRINGLVQHPAQPNILYALTRSQGLRRIDLASGGGWAQQISFEAPSTPYLLESAGRFAPPRAAEDFLEPGQESRQELSNTAAISAPILSMTFSPSNANITYLGTDGAGVYRSSDGGNSWSPAGLPGGAIRDLTVDPMNPGIVYAVTNQPGIIYRTPDGGNYWEMLNLPDSTVSVFAVETWRGDLGGVYVGTSNGIERFDGNSWNHVGLQGYSIFSLGDNPASATRLYAGTDKGVFGSRSGYDSWLPVSTEITDYSTVSMNFNPGDANHIYIGTATRGTLRVSTKP